MASSSNEESTVAAASLSGQPWPGRYLRAPTRGALTSARSGHTACPLSAVPVQLECRGTRVSSRRRPLGWRSLCVRSLITESRPLRPTLR